MVFVPIIFFIAIFFIITSTIIIIVWNIRRRRGRAPKKWWLVIPVIILIINLITGIVLFLSLMNSSGFEGGGMLRPNIVSSEWVTGEQYLTDNPGLIEKYGEGFTIERGTGGVQGELNWRGYSGYAALNYIINGEDTYNLLLSRVKGGPWVVDAIIATYPVYRCREIDLRFCLKDLDMDAPNGVYIRDGEEIGVDVSISNPSTIWVEIPKHEPHSYISEEGETVHGIAYNWEPIFAANCVFDVNRFTAVLTDEYDGVLGDGVKELSFYIDKSGIDVKPFVYPDIFELKFSDLTNPVFNVENGDDWGNTIIISPDGAFSGFSFELLIGGIDLNEDDRTKNEYRFDGEFSNLMKTGDYEYSMKCESLSMTDAAGEEIIDGTGVITAGVIDYRNGDEFLLFLSGKRVTELPENFLIWAGGRRVITYEDADRIDFYGLYHVREGKGFIATTIRTDYAPFKYL